MDELNRRIKLEFLKKLLEDIEFNCYPETDGKNKVYRTRMFFTFTEHEYILLKTIIDDIDDNLIE